MIKLKKHPFAMEAFFKSSVVLTFAAPKEQLQNMIPNHLTLDTFQDKWAFIAVAIVSSSALRPKGFPRFIGKNFFLVGYRVFVQYINKKGKRLRGLYIIKSETNKWSMTFFGNILTHYNYTTTDILQIETNRQKSIHSKDSKFSLYIDKNLETSPLLPNNSPFNNWKEARRFTGPLPFTFTYNQKDNTMLIIEGVRENWKPEPIQIK